MAHAVEQQRLSASADEVWRAIGGFGALAAWHPGIRSVELADGGRIRRLALTGGAHVIERLQSFSESERTYSYTIEDGPLPVRGYTSWLRVTAIDAATSRVEWSGEFVPEGVPEPDALAIVRAIYRAGLGQLQQRFGGSTP